MSMVSPRPEVSSRVRRAWEWIPRSGLPLRGTFTLGRIDRIIQIVTAIAFLTVGGQTALIAWGDRGAQGGGDAALSIPVLVALAIASVCGLLGRGVAIAYGVLAVALVVALALWPAVADAGGAEAGWTWYLLNVATVAAAVAWPWPWPLTWLFAVPAAYAAARVAGTGFAPEVARALIPEVAYALVLGGVVLTLIVAFRRTAAGVDRERARVVSTYAYAAASEAVRAERASLEAMLHDSVLAALIAAGRADTRRSRALVVSMAERALEGLDAAAWPPSAPQGGASSPRSITALADDLAAAVAPVGVAPDVVTLSPRGLRGAPPIPPSVVAALVRATTQAVANSVRHAEGAALSVRVGRPRLVCDGAPGVRVVIHDDGPGFDPAAIPADRMGVRASILSRMSRAGGAARIVSGSHGTTVTLAWLGD